MVGRDVPLYCCDHAPRDVVRRPGDDVQDLSSLRGRRVVLWSAIARPQSFRETAAKLGCEIVGEQVHRDHHRFTAADVAAAQLFTEMLSGKHSQPSEAVEFASR